MKLLKPIGLKYRREFSDASLSNELYFRILLIIPGILFSTLLLGIIANNNSLFVHSYPLI